MDREMILEILHAFDQSTASSFELELPGGKLSLAKEGQQSRPTVASLDQQAAPEPMMEQEAANVETVCAPLVGIFYEAAAPGEAPFVRPGDRVEVGQVVGIIEAMKVMNEIKSKIGGRVLSVEKADASLCEYGDVLVRIEVDA